MIESFKDWSTSEIGEETLLKIIMLSCLGVFLIGRYFDWGPLPSERKKTMGGRKRKYRKGGVV